MQRDDFSLTILVWLTFLFLYLSTSPLLLFLYSIFHLW